MRTVHREQRRANGILLDRIHGYIGPRRNGLKLCKGASAPHRRPGERTSSLGGSQEEAGLGESLRKAGQPRNPGKGREGHRCPTQ